jgi:hypothetical protein
LNINKMLLNMMFPISIDSLLNKFNNLSIYFEKDKRSEEYHLMRKYSGVLTRDIIQHYMNFGKFPNVVDLGAGREKYLEQLIGFKNLHMIDNDIISCAQFLDELKRYPILDISTMKYIVASLADDKNNDKIANVCKNTGVIMCMFSIHYYFKNFFEILKLLIKQSESKEILILIGFIDLYNFNNAKYPVQHEQNDMIRVKLPFTDESYEEKVSLEKILEKLKEISTTFTIEYIKYNDLKKIDKLKNKSINYEDSYNLLSKDDKEWIDHHHMAIINLTK